MQLLTEFLAGQGIIAGIDPDTDRIVELTSTSFPTSPLIASTVALVIAATPWLSHQWRRVLWPCVGLLVLFRVVSSNEPPLDVVIAIAVGMAMGSLALLVFGTEGSDPDAPELVAMLRTAGRPARIEQLPGSAPARLRGGDGGPRPWRCGCARRTTAPRTCSSSSGGRCGCGRG